MVDEIVCLQCITKYAFRGASPKMLRCFDEVCYSFDER